MGRRRKSPNRVAFVLQLNRSQFDQKISVVDYAPKVAIKAWGGEARTMKTSVICVLRHSSQTALRGLQMWAEREPSLRQQASDE